MQGQRTFRLSQQLANGRAQSLRQAHAQRKVKSLESLTRNYEEISIPVPWGQIAGKWYGPKDVRPILGMHGLMDNAGTFDTLAPLLPPHLSFLSIDAPGHGLSSWLPQGMMYHSIDFVQQVLRVMEEYKWDKVSIMAHSMSSITGFVFGALYPDKLDMFIGLDELKPHVRKPHQIVNALSERVEGMLKLERRISGDTEPPAYEWDEMVARLHVATNKSVDLDSCKYLLQRNCKPSRHDPNKYYFTRDLRLRHGLFYLVSNDTVLEMAKCLKSPHLFIRALQAPLNEHKKYYEETLAVLRQNPLFEYQEVDGSHHVHLNEPEKVADLINSFIDKHRQAA